MSGVARRTLLSAGLRPCGPLLSHQIATHPIHHRLHDTLARVGRDCAIHRRAARLEHVKRTLRA